MIAPPSASLAAPFLQYFFAEHLIAHRRVSPETVATYRDTFRLLLQFLQVLHWQRAVAPHAGGYAGSFHSAIPR